MNETSNNKFLLPAAVLIGLVFIGGAVLYSGSHSGGGTTTKPLSAIAKKVAADVQQNKTAYDAALNVDKGEAAKPKLSATPSFLFGKQAIAGAYPYATFKAAIDNAIAGKAPTADGQGLTISTVDGKDITAAGNPFIGKEDAPLTILFWSDFQCPFCKRFELETLPQIITEYVDTGKVKVVFMDFPFLGQDSIAAGEYSRAVWKLYPAQYFAWRTAMYNAQDDEGDRGFGDTASIDELNSTVLK